MSFLYGRLSRKTTRWIIAVSLLVLLYAVAGFFIAPPIIRSQLESILTEQLNHPVAVKEVRLNPFALSLTLREVAVTEPDRQPLVGFEEFYVNVEAASVINRALTFSAIRLLRPYAVVKVRQDGTLNLADLRPKAPAEPAEPAKPVGPPPQTENGPPSADKSLPGVIIELLDVEGGILEFHDESKPTSFSTDIVPISFSLQRFSTRPDTPDVLSFQAEIGPGEEIEWHGAFHIEPLDSEGRLTLTGLKARTIWSYIQDRVNFEITDGVINVTAVYRFKLDREALQASITEGSVTVAKLAIAERGFRQPLILVPEFAVNGIEADLPSRSVRIADVRSRDARIEGWLYPDRRTSFQDLFLPEGNQAPAPSPSSKPEGPPWSVKIARVSIENYGIAVEDRAPATPVRLSVNPLRIALENVSTKLDAPIALDVAARINETGSVAVKGSATPDPLALELDLDVAKIAFPPFQPYVDRVARVNVTSGSANLAGHVSYRAQPTKQPQIQFRGKASVADLATQDAALGKDLLKWTELAFNGIAADVEPTKVEIAEIVATKPYVNLVIAPDRTTNVQQLLVKPDAELPPEETPPAAAQQTPPPPVRIGLIRLADGAGHFADFSLKPVIDTGIYGLTGTIKGLSSKELSKADVSLEGRVDKYAPMSVKGSINPLTSDAFTDIAVSFKNVELTTVSPYATKFAGHPIKKGKISLDLRYKLSKHILEAENDVVIEQLTLGDKVESPDAVSLPLKLAVALLKDRNGVIDIDLPIRGDLNDPDFKYGRVLLGVLMNLLTKAVTSPFNLVAGLVGGSGEELSTVQFEAGSPTLAPNEEQKLTTLAKALDERPALRLEIAGAADARADRAALAETKLYRELAALKNGESRTADGAGPSADAFRSLPEPEQADLITTLYRRKYGALPEPPPADGQAPAVPASTQSLKDRLVSDTAVEDSELRRLAQDRGKLVQQFLVTQGSINPERLYLLDVQLNANASDGTVPNSLNLTAE